MVLWYCYVDLRDVALLDVFYISSLLSEEHTTVKLKVFHRNLIGKDDFLGYAEIKMDPSLVYERPQSR